MMVCFFGKSRTLLPSPMVSRNTWGSKLGRFLGAGGGRVEFRVSRGFCSIGAKTATFVEPLDSRSEAMGTPPLIRSVHVPAYYIAFAPMSFCVMACLDIHLLRRKCWKFG